MKKSTNIDVGSLIAIVFASVVVSGSLVFFGMQMTSGGGLSDEALAARIDDGIERYVELKQKEAEEQQTQLAAQQAQQTKEMAQNVPAVSDADHMYGDKNAKISLVEYSDFQCPYCKGFHATAKQLIDTHPGEVNWVYRHFPLSFHDPAATRQAIASECVAEIGGNEKFWEFSDLLFSQGPSDNDSLTAAASGLGLDASAFATCLESGRYDEKIKRHIAEGTASGVTGTPGNILLNKETGEAVLVEGAQPLGVFEQVLEDMKS